MSGNTGIESNNPIDAVILWVDGNDPVLSGKRNSYLKKEDKPGGHSGALPTFFASNNEIRYCVLSIMTFAPFVRNIFIVTDGQDPNLYEDIETYFPGRSASMRIVDHKEIFRGYEKYLPNFNSTSINSLIWRIKGLSENFIIFSDDVFLIREHKPEDWFINNRPVLRGEWKPAPVKKIFSDYIKTVINRKNADYQPRLSSYLRQWNGAYLLGFRFRYFYLGHTPHPLNRVRHENFFAEKSELLEKNISPRFRSKDQFITAALIYYLEILDGNRQIERPNQGYFHPYYSDKRMKRKIRRCETDTSIKSVCVQSMDMLSEELQTEIFTWMDRVLNLEPGIKL